MHQPAFSLAECDPNKCVNTTIGCPLGFMPQMNVTTENCCPTYTCSEYKHKDKTQLQNYKTDLNTEVTNV